MTRRLAWFFLCNALVLNLVLVLLPWTPRRLTALQYTGGWLLGYFGTDSWDPMQAALAQLAAHPTEPLYHALFFTQHAKFLYPPSSLLIVQAFQALPAPFAAFQWVSWLATLGTAIVVALIFDSAMGAPLAVPRARRDRVAQAVLALACALTFYPLLKAFRLGQMQTWINFAFALILWSWMRGRDTAAGVLAGMICLVKPQHAVLLLWGLLRQRWRFAAAMTVVLVIAAAASLAEFGVANHLDYLSVLSFLMRHGESFSANQSVNGLLHRLLGNGDALEWHPDVYPPFSAWVYGGTLLSSAGLIALGLFWRRREHARAGTTDLMIALLTVTLASPLVWEHYYGVLMPIYAVTLPALLQRPVFGWATMPYLGATYVLASNYFGIAQHTADTAFNPVQSYLLFAALMVLVCLYALRRAESGDAPALPGWNV